MCICVYVYMCICVYVYMCICVCVYVYIRAHVLSIFICVSVVVLRQVQLCGSMFAVCGSLLQGVVVCCSVSQCVAVCCSVYDLRQVHWITMLQYV